MFLIIHQVYITQVQKDTLRHKFSFFQTKTEDFFLFSLQFFFTQKRPENKYLHKFLLIHLTFAVNKGAITRAKLLRSITLTKHYVFVSAQPCTLLESSSIPISFTAWNQHDFSHSLSFLKKKKKENCEVLIITIWIYLKLQAALRILLIRGNTGGHCMSLPDRGWSGKRKGSWDLSIWFCGEGEITQIAEKKA